MGYGTLGSNTIGYNNTGTGYTALSATTTGINNTGDGSAALFLNTTGSYNTAMGIQASNFNTTGSNNTTIGAEAMLYNISGSNNIALGYWAGSSLTSGDNNIFIGSSVQPNISVTASNQLNIGNWIYGSNGNIGIGITTVPAGYKLAVAGNIITEKIKVKLQSAGWPDYVFHHQYQILSLNDLEKYIQQNKHLPDVPSASEVEKDGLDLGDNQSILLKKIEELTLYVIEINKKVEKLSEENELLKKKIQNKQK